MRIARLFVDGRDTAEVLVADRIAGRLRGMLGRGPLPEALMLRPANSVHGVGMHSTLDVAALDRTGVVLAVHVLRPWRATATVTGGRDVLEAPEGGFTRWGLARGALVTIE